MRSRGMLLRVPVLTGTRRLMVHLMSAMRVAEPSIHLMIQTSRSWFIAPGSGARREEEVR